jgi:adenine phosphoribosyltransferase
MNYQNYIGVINGFPKEGISFKDISPLLRDGPAFHQCISDLVKLAKPYRPTVIIAAEARGFVFASAMAAQMGIGFVMARKKGKLPGHNISVTYALEYGTDTLEIRDSSFKEGDRVLLVDDLIATGGSFKALKELTVKAKGTPVAAIAVIRLSELEGEKKVGLPTKWLIDLSAEK